MSHSAAGKVVILDRDGTIVRDCGYLSNPDGLEFLPGAANGLRSLHQQGYRLVVISNQSGVGRGLFPLERLREMNARLEEMVQTIGARIERIYCCPHRPDENCRCRKPQTGLLERAAMELGFDPTQSIVIGDKGSDVEFGRRAGALTLLIGNRNALDPHASIGPDHVVEDLCAAAAMLGNLKLGNLKAGAASAIGSTGK